MMGSMAKLLMEREAVNGDDCDDDGNEEMLKRFIKFDQAREDGDDRVVVFSSLM